MTDTGPEGFASAQAQATYRSPVLGSSPASVAVSAAAVVKRYTQGTARIDALREVSLTIPAGQFLAVMGPSGCGKSTLLHAIAGLTRPDVGKIVVENTDIATLNDRQLTHFRRRRVGLVFQSFNLIPTLTAADNIKLSLLADGRARDAEARLPVVLERLGLTNRRNHRPDALSGGEQQRVAIARAMITDATMLLADEPTGNLDSISGQYVCRLLQELCQEQSRTIVLVTHEPAVAVWAERVVVMRDGQVLAEFATREFSQPHRLAAHYQDLISEPRIGSRSAPNERNS